MQLISAGSWELLLSQTLWRCRYCLPILSHRCRCQIWGTIWARKNRFLAADDRIWAAPILLTYCRYNNPTTGPNLRSAWQRSTAGKSSCRPSTFLREHWQIWQMRRPVQNQSGTMQSPWCCGRRWKIRPPFQSVYWTSLLYHMGREVLRFSDPKKEKVTAQKVQSSTRKTNLLKLTTNRMHKHLRKNERR